MKKIIFYLTNLVIISLFLIYITSCANSAPMSTFENVEYNADSAKLTFDLTISDNKSVGSDYKVCLKQTGNDESIDSKDITVLTKTNYEFDNVVSNTNYTLYVTCTYNGESDYQIKYSKTFNTTGTDYLQELEISYEDTTVEYTGEAQQIYATYESNGVTTNIEENVTYTNENTLYMFNYSNTLNQINVGTYTQTLTIYKCYSYGFSSITKTKVAEISRTLTITKAKLLGEVSDLSVEYTGEEISMPETNDKLTYVYYNENDEQIDSIIYPGTYKVCYSFIGDDNYEAESGEFSVTVEKKTITSTLTNQTVVLSDGKASLYVSDSCFNESGLNYSVTYKDLEGNTLDTSYVTSVGKYIVVVSADETDYTKAFSVTLYLTVTDTLTNESLLVSNVEYFAVSSQTYFMQQTYRFAYLGLYNDTNSAIDLSTISLYFNGKQISLSATLNSKETYVLLLYTNGTKVNNVNYASYADYAVNVSFTKISSISTLINNNLISYSIDSSYNNYYGYLSDRTNYNYTFTSISNISTAINYVSNFAYTTEEPTVTYSFDFDTISKTRTSDLYNINATDALGNSIEISSDMIDTSEIKTSNVGKSINIYYNVYDSYGNIASFIKQFTLVDEEGPQIELSNDVLEGSLTMHVNKGTTLDLTKYFVVNDEVDGLISVTSDMIEGNDLDTNVMGKYTITITASDSSNNKSTFSITLYVDCGTLSDLTSETIKSSLTGEANAMPSTGNVSVLVVPVFFKQSNETVAYLNNLETVFNDTTNSLAIGSVKSYYETSSYNKMSLTFDIYRSSYITLPQSKKYYDNNIDQLFEYALNQIDSSVDFSKYDSDNDGTIDAIWFIYDIDYDNNTNYFWAWTSDMSEYLSDRDNKHVGKICFASYEFINSSDDYYSSYSDSETSSLTARTYIHETGHLFGLFDYYDYDYDYTVGVHHTMFGCSMMDSNLGDLDSASKILLGWIDPIVVSETEVITINPTALTGDAIVIAKESRINNTIFSEFIILEFWTSDSLNKTDSAQTFGTDNYGIRVLHLDANINYDSSGNPTLTKGNRPSYFKYNNTDDDSHNFLETLAINSSSVYSARTKKYTTIGNVLFTDTNTVFGTDVYSNFTYNDKSSLDFTFKILNLTRNEARILVTFK